MFLQICLLLWLFYNPIHCLGDGVVPDVLSKIKAGFEIAGKFLGINQSTNLAQMVSQTFSGKHIKKNGNFKGDTTIFSGFLRLLGLDTKKLSAIAVNAIIFVAQMISSSLSKPTQLIEARKMNEGTPLDWILTHANAAQIIEAAKDHNLPNQMVEYVKERDLDEDTDCVQLLICKSAPFIWGMQKTLNTSNDKSSKGPQILYNNLPTVDQVAEHEETCESKHPYCLLYY